MSSSTEEVVQNGTRTSPINLSPDLLCFTSFHLISYLQGRWELYKSLLALCQSILFIIMPIEDFELKEPLGKGSFGCVCKCIRKSDGEVYAMKQVLLSLLRSRFTNWNKKINKMHSIRFASLPLFKAPMLYPTKRPFMMINQKCYASSWSSPMRATYRYISGHLGKNQEGYDYQKPYPWRIDLESWLQRVIRVSQAALG